ncbi:MAG: MBOAT family protein [Spirochaetaceae bacterium]|jgi:D-alanyl-lipoteichoic acid acyltransferase DltB (MBOAT superfamily)|nr:MBOAT family protein [Spirochaetaceae bacterium]
MVFNSWQFLVFFLGVSAWYFMFTLKLHKPQWARVLLLLASLCFYGYGNPWYVGLILFSVVITWAGALLMEKEEKARIRKKFVLGLVLTLNLGVLFWFKYYNFFAETWYTWAGLLGGQETFWKKPLDILLPVGISFYTFQALGYAIDVYRGAVPAERNLLYYTLFVTFFPQLVAGPIERTAHLLPQFKRSRGFDYDRVTSGLRQAAWGMFKKVVVADRLAVYVNAVFDAPDAYPASALALGVLFFTFQIYGDFSGYSDIAVGTARVLGFDLSANFRAPYFSKTLRDFWRRWHISLSGWFKDYLYFPLGGNRKGFAPVNLLITFIVSGLWHGAAWHFVAWGLLHGLFQVAERALNIREPSGPGKYLQGGCTFVLVSFTWIFFRAHTLTEALFISARLAALPLELAGFIRRLPQTGLINSVREAFQLGSALQGVTSPIPQFSITQAGLSLICIAALLVGDWGIHTGKIRVSRLSLVPRWAVYYTLIFTVFLSWDQGASLFIYFTF